MWIKYLKYIFVVSLMINNFLKKLWLKKGMLFDVCYVKINVWYVKINVISNEFVYDNIWGYLKLIKFIWLIGIIIKL